MPGDSDLRSIVSELHNALSHNKDLDMVTSLLSRAKRSLLEHNALIPSPSLPPEIVALGREVLEIGALASIRQTDAPTFTRYYQQLQPFYDLERDVGAPGEKSGQPKMDSRSSQRSKITGLYLLLLLSMGDSTGFHTVLEGLVEEASLKGKNVEDDPYIKYPVELERSLMEGSYDKVWRETKSERVPSEDFGLFSNVSLPSCGLHFLENSPVFCSCFGDMLTLLRSSLVPSAARLPTAPRKPIPPFPSPMQRTFSSSTQRAL